MALAAALPAMATAETSPSGELLELMERHRVTLGICQALVNKADSVHEDYDPSCLDAFNAAENEEDALLLAIAGFPANCQADHVAKARYLLARSDAGGYWVNPELYGALLASLAGEND
ncbi:hypothetical protein IHQ71_24205 [Rhizobium sp. TH2]|uniref:hypothetical protein n=1 Tax=Rhizobium sp. TH2 TaxID=2775403 RepID=UPI002157B7B7|nr:hypothetical protein [Rhizobium sp. TH2]UVC08223.1 hypothetical protein IHQ71_24205 [Rhizobium sp. TH2]